MYKVPVARGNVSETSTVRWLVWGAQGMRKRMAGARHRVWGSWQGSHVALEATGKIKLRGHFHPYRAIREGI